MAGRRTSKGPNNSIKKKRLKQKQQHNIYYAAICMSIHYDYARDDEDHMGGMRCGSDCAHLNQVGHCAPKQGRTLLLHLHELAGMALLILETACAGCVCVCVCVCARTFACVCARARERECVCGDAGADDVSDRCVADA